MSKQVWISEQEAAQIIRRHPRYFRQLVKQGTLDVSYRTFNGRTYEYDVKAIERIKNKEARIVA